MGVSGHISPSDPDSSESRFNVFLLLKPRIEVILGITPWLAALMVLPLDEEVIDVGDEEVDGILAVVSVVGEIVR